jgi:hypothetical protein
VIFLQPNWIFAFVCAFIFYGAGQMEARETGRDNGILWAGLSIAISALVIQVFHGGWVPVLLAQGGFFVGIGVFRVLRESKKGNVS